MNKEFQSKLAFVGDTGSYLATQAREYDPMAQLIDHTNYEEFLSGRLCATTIYTSLGDFNGNLPGFYQVIRSCSKIVYAPPTSWSDGQEIDLTIPTTCVQGLTENLLLLAADQIDIENIEACYFYPQVNPLVDTRKLSDSQLWIAGCSISHGVGVESNQRYGQLVANELDLPVSFLTMGGSSVAWSADQILRSDLRAGDILVWGITGTFRTHYIKDKLLHQILINSYQKTKEITQIVPLDTLVSENTVYHNLYSIEQVINFCKKCQVKLVLLGLLTGNDMLRYLKTQPNYFNFPYKFDFLNNIPYIQYLDFGSDNKHPGPKQHQQYAEFVLQILKQHSV